MGRGKAAHYGSCQEVSHQTVQSLIGLEVFLIPFPFIVSPWSLRGGQSPVVAAHSYCGGKGAGGVGGRHCLGLICLVVRSPWVIQQQARAKQQHYPAIPSAAAGEHGLGLAALPCSCFPRDLGETCGPICRGRYGLLGGGLAPLWDEDQG